MSPSVTFTRPALVALCLALVMTALNLFEPLTVDDVCHQYYAAQVAAAPLDPFGFELPWHQKPVSAWDVMVAPVTSYYWASAIALFGDEPVAWKAWFLPLQWLFCFSLLVLLQRVVRRSAVAVTAMIALGPTVLPGVNLMLEIPVLALGFASVALLLRAGDRRSVPTALLAGLCLGLAFQTKYSAMGFFAPWVLLGGMRARWRELGLGLLTAVAVALAIEWLLSVSHGGGSYFMRQLHLTQRRDWSHLVKGMITHVGLLGMPAVLLALHGLRAAKWAQWLALLVYAGGYVVIATVPDIDGRTILDGAWDSLAYLAMAILTWGVLAWLMLTLALAAGRSLWRRHWSPSVLMRAFLVAWFFAEIAASLVVSPFPAARRSLLIVLAATCAAAWLAVRRAGATPVLQGVAVLTSLLGVGYQAIDCLEGRACVVATERAAAFARERDPAAKVFFTGGWGFEFYGPRVGMQPLLRGRSSVAKGDWIAIGSIDGAEEPWFEWSGKMNLITEIAVGDAVPLSLLFGYYSGRRPLDGQRGPRFVVWLFRAVESFHAADLVAKVNPWRDH